MATEDEISPGATVVPGDQNLPVDAPAETEHRPVSRLVFPVAGYGLFLDQRSTMEYLESQTSFYIPNNHPLFRGLINRRGSLVPLFDIRILFDDVVADREGSRVLVLGAGDNAVAIVLDATPYRVSVFEENKASPPIKLVQVFGEFLGECLERDGECFTRVALEEFLYSLVHEAT